jgi:MFS family permease
VHGRSIESIRYDEERAVSVQVGGPAVAAVGGGPVRRAHVGVITAFVTAGIAFTGLASRIPDVRGLLGLTPSELGLLLLAISTGAVLALPASGWVCGRIGAALAVLTGAAALSVGLVVAGVGTALPAVWLTAAGLFLVGLGTGTWDVAMNLQGTVVERGLGRNVMPHYHAWFSLGSVGAAGLGALATWAQVPVVVHLVLTGVVALVAAGLAARRFLPASADAPDSSGTLDAPDAAARPVDRRHPLAAWMEPRTLLIGVLVLAAAFTEGVAMDWLSVGVIDGYATPTWVGGLAFAAFVTAMTVGRVLGTSWLDRYGRLPVLRTAFGLAAVGSLMVIFGPALGPTLGLAAAFAGALLWGLGASLGFPVGMSAAADDPRYAAARVSVVASIGYLAFLAGPPLLGFLGDHVGVLRALLAVVTVTLAALLVVPASRPLPAAGATAERATADR